MPSVQDPCGCGPAHWRAVCPDMDNPVEQGGDLGRGHQPGDRKVVAIAGARGGVSPGQDGPVVGMEPQAV